MPVDVRKENFIGNRELNLELSELYAVKVARTVLNGESGSNAADLHN